MTAKTITCPDCGLLLRVARDPAASTSVYDYDINDWKRRCKRLDLGPVWCLNRCNGTSPASAVLDGEIVASDRRGVPNFARLHLRSGSANGFHLWCFDLLALNGRGWRHQPLEKRQDRLQALLQRFDCPPVKASEAFTDGVKLVRVAERMRLEGVVSKRRGTAYSSGDCRDWRPRAVEDVRARTRLSAGGMVRTGTGITDARSRECHGYSFCAPTGMVAKLFRL